MSTRQSGADYEQRARRFLEHQGLVFVTANVHVRGGEIDIIMRDHQVIVFVEVRFRQNNTFGSAAESITKTKQKRLLHAAKVWLSGIDESFETVDCRFDVLAFTGNEIEWLTNAFATDI